MPKQKKAERFGKQPPRHNFFLNPYTDARFTRCPKCDAKTKQRKLPLFIFVPPTIPIALNKTCRYCPACDLLIAHKDELDALLTAMFTQSHQPAMIGHDYLVVGTVDRADWQEGNPVKHIDELRAIVHDFKKVLDFEPQRYGWVKEDGNGWERMSSLGVDEAWQRMLTDEADGLLATNRDWRQIRQRKRPLIRFIRYPSAALLIRFIRYPSAALLIRFIRYPSAATNA